MPVSLYGQCADYDEINGIAERHGLPVIEDGCQSFGAIYRGKNLATLQPLATPVSSHPSLWAAMVMQVPVLLMMMS